MKDINKLYEELRNAETERDNLNREISIIKNEIQYQKEQEFSNFDIEDLLSYGREIAVCSNDGDYYICVYNSNGAIEKTKHFSNIEDLKMFLKIISK